MTFSKTVELRRKSEGRDWRNYWLENVAIDSVEPAPAKIVRPGSDAKRMSLTRRLHELHRRRPNHSKPGIVITYEISDEALETAAGTASKAGSYTLSFCTALDHCTGP